MRRRLYFMLPNVPSANTVANELLLARVDDRYMHFLARRGTVLGKLREAGVTHKSDLVHGAEAGLTVGAACGLVVGICLYFFQPVGIPLQMVVILASGLAGALFGAWTGSMAGASIPNSKLRQFATEIDQGNVLLIVDIPRSRIGEIEEIVATRHPEAIAEGFEPTMPAFP